MPYYNLYFLRRDGKIAHIISCEAADDAQAEECLKTHSHAHPIELWQESRLVGRYAPVRCGVFERLD